MSRAFLLVLKEKWCVVVVVVVSRRYGLGRAGQVFVRFVSGSFGALKDNLAHLEWLSKRLSDSLEDWAFASKFREKRCMLRERLNVLRQRVDQRVESKCRN